jgi:hypothetical protein
VADELGFGLDRFQGRGIHREFEGGRQTDRPDHPKRVFLESLRRVAHRA